MRIAVALLVCGASVVCLACGGGGGGGRLFRQYEYEEEMYLALDGSATVYVNSSLPALNALRGASFDTRTGATVNRSAVRAYFNTPVTRATRVATSRRRGRDFVHVRIAVDDVRRLGEAAPFAWSTYAFSNADGVVAYRQAVGPAADKPVEEARWKGDEIVAFRLHIPSRIVFHNAGASNLKRGNILVWEQPLAERLRGTPLLLDARMEPRSILYRTLILFGGTIVAVAAMFAVVVWRVRRAGDRRAGKAG